MPGVRLTAHDRRRIADGLAEGLSYGEIARRLDRPTSTVTREITRNGGPSGYRPDRAQQAAVRRARRGRPTPAPGGVPDGPAPAATDPYGRDGEAVDAFADELARLLTVLGLPPMAARVVACLSVTDDGSLTAADLTRRLGVSPASVSKAVAYLEGQELLRRRRDGPRDRERYVIDGDVWRRSLLASAHRNALLAATTRRGAHVLGPATPAGARMDGAAALLDHIVEAIIRTVGPPPHH
ncbi:GbsR/MarR family transcriptional regulator [Kitasatospora camelliae]|uniref:Helix-turn-helix domain-containing protein n=1 Tax=Kitasatospora camelliae TaxID=3156397 RepID=A0AAU8JRD6_9ACTN